MKRSPSALPSDTARQLAALTAQIDLLRQEVASSSTNRGGGGGGDAPATPAREVLKSPEPRRPPKSKAAAAAAAAAVATPVPTVAASDREPPPAALSPERPAKQKRGLFGRRVPSMAAPPGFAAAAKSAGSAVASTAQGVGHQVSGSGSKAAGAEGGGGGGGGDSGGGTDGKAKGSTGFAGAEPEADSFAVLSFGDLISLTLTDATSGVGILVGETRLDRLGVARQSSRGPSSFDGTFGGGLNPEDAAFRVCPKLNYRATKELEALQ
jgi:hypothetical protein